MTQTVVINGGSAGIGRATARLFGRRGDRVAVLARGTDGLAGAAEDIGAAGGTALPISADMADYAQLDAAAERIERELGPIDIWINAGFSSVFAPFAEISPEEFRRVTDVTYLGFVHGTMAALSRMRVRDHGTIVQVGSALSERSIPLQSAYCGAKHGVVGFTSALRIAARGLERARDRRADAGREHTTVLLGPLQAAESAAAGGADLPA
jgi:NAD(P)-dependent dehydrogenase (short-subunit alcohol dehydrogenase family)